MTAPNATQCPADSVLSAFGLGKLDASGAETVSRHLDTCADCQRRVAGISGDSFVGRLRQAEAAAPAARGERAYPPDDSSVDFANSTDGMEDGLPRPSSESNNARLDGPGRPVSSDAAPLELANEPGYELLRQLGQGGMGAVYLAHNRMMDRPEALKVLTKDLLKRPGSLERFQQEIRSAAKLAHPNIVTAYSVLRPGDLLVFAMEYVPGQNLSELVRQRGPLPVADAAFYIHQVALGLQHGFEKGMVHRDVKPSNLMLAIDGEKQVVKILDFGLAKATSEKSLETSLTDSGQLLGTPDYIAPEQTLDAHEADIRADVYSLGCTLYFLLTGEPPFRETSVFKLLQAHQSREPRRLDVVRPAVPAELADIVVKMMAKDPSDRYQTPIQVARALEPFFKSPSDGIPSADAHNNGGGIAKRTSGRSIGPALRRLIATSLTAAVVLLGVVFLIHTPKGNVRIELSDPSAKVTVEVDGDLINISGLDKPLFLLIGDHDLIVKGAGYETITKHFKVARGINAPVTIELLRVDHTSTPEPLKQPGSAPGEANQAKVSVADKLTQITSLSFPRNTLEQSLKILGDDIGVEIIILGNDLREEGKRRPVCPKDSRSPLWRRPELGRCHARSSGGCPRRQIPDHGGPCRGGEQRSAARAHEEPRHSLFARRRHTHGDVSRRTGCLSRRGRPASDAKLRADAPRGEVWRRQDVAGCARQAQAAREKQFFVGQS